MQNKPVPYEGKEKYGFISYCHKDGKTVFKIMEIMSGQGCRVWYDAGIPIGSEFPEVIAEHLMRAEVCIAFLSNAYMESDFCRIELNYALKKRKKLILLYIEQVNLTSGFEMRLDMIQSVLLYQKEDLHAALKDVCQSEIITSCIGHSYCEDQKELLPPENNSKDVYLSSMQLLEKVKSINDSELNRVVSELRKINGFLRNDNDFGEGSPQVLYCEYQIQEELEQLSNELADFLSGQNADRAAAVTRMLRSCMEISVQLKIRAEKMKK